MTWFSQLTGIADETAETVAKSLHIEGEDLVSNANGRRFQVGALTCPTLAQIQDDLLPDTGLTTVREVVADIRDLHVDEANADAVFQVASQFNLLEMIGPSFGPEDGVGRYENDRTQGPACAIACGAGTIYRNYFVPIGSRIGQNAGRQIDCLADFSDRLKNAENGYWQMQNGYALPRPDGLTRLNKVLMHMTSEEIDQLRGLVRVGIMTDTQVTLANTGHCVTQIYCSAMPVAYGFDPAEAWQPLATLILEAAYEATLRTAARVTSKRDNKTVFLTLLGGGAFGNRPEWIVQAALRALHILKHSGMNVVFVSYGRPDQTVQEIIDSWSESTGKSAALGS